LPNNRYKKALGTYLGKLAQQIEGES